MPPAMRNPERTPTKKLAPKPPTPKGKQNPAPALLPTRWREPELIGQEAFDATTLQLQYEPIMTPTRDAELVKAYMKYDAAKRALADLSKE